ncbi:MAG: 30S ribosomal protein S6 [Candidatus Paceibacterota bacterium]|jgi:ribosomal protein S6
MSKKPTVAKNNEEKVYEVGYHLLSSVAEENISEEAAKIKAYLSKEKAEIISEEAPKLRPLAYPIKKAFGGVYKTFDKAYFGFIKFALTEGGDITKIDQAMKANESILRYIVVKTVRENTMYSPKITIFSDKESKIKIPTTKAEIIGKPASVEEIDKSIDELLTSEVKV